MGEAFEAAYMAQLVSSGGLRGNLVSAPDQSREFPRDLTRVSPRDLGRYLSEFTRDLAWAIVQLSLAEARATHSRHQLDTATEFWTFRLSPDNPRDVLKADLLARVGRKKQVSKWKEQSLLDTASVTVMKAQKEALAAYVSAVSREITRRSDEARGGGRIT